jgi:hypothetical protein
VWQEAETTSNIVRLEESDFPREAVLALYRSGIRYIATYMGEYFFQDLLREHRRFGLKLVGHNDAGVVFEILP